jgi:hypothetical protein
MRAQPVRDGTLYLSKIPVLPSQLRKATVISRSGKFFGPARTPYFTATLSADTPSHASTLLITMLRQAANYSTMQAQASAINEEAALVQQLSRIRGRRRGTILARLGALARFVARPSARIVLGPGPAKPAIRTWADRLVAKLPGTFPPRPDPWVLALAGIVVVFGYWLLI